MDDFDWNASTYQYSKTHFVKQQYSIDLDKGLDKQDKPIRVSQLKYITQNIYSGPSVSSKSFLRFFTSFHHEIDILLNRLPKKQVLKPD